MTNTFDWFDLLIDVICKRIEEGDPAAAAYLRTRIEAAFVPVSAAKALMNEKHKEAAEAKLWFEKAQEWRGELTAATARAEAAEAENVRLREALRECRDQLWHLAKNPASNPWIKQADAALGAEHE